MIRNEFDTLKVFATILVVIGHITILYTPQSAFEDIQVNSTMSFLTNGIYLFHMPLFMFISGMFVYSALNKPFKTVIVNKTRQLLYPIVIWSMILYIISPFILLKSTERGG